jgi:hypothetical protein
MDKSNTMDHWLHPRDKLLAGATPNGSTTPSAKSPRKRPAIMPALMRTEQLRRQLASATAELALCRHKLEWLESALAEQRHARQVLEAAVAARYPEAVSRIRQVVEATLPRGATVLVVSKGDEDLIRFVGRTGWHFPRGDHGEFAGHYPATSAAAIAHLRLLIDQGARYLVFPCSAFWWLIHYPDLARDLEQRHSQIRRDEHCVIFKLAADRRGAIAMEPRHEISSGQAQEAHDLSTLHKSGFQGPKAGIRVKPARTGFPDIVCFSIINWNYRFQRPQQLMSQFAAAGHRVFYLSHDWLKSDRPYRLRPRAPNLYEASLRGAGFKVRQGVLDEDSREALFAALSALRQDVSLDSAVAMIQLALWWPMAKEAAAAFGWPVIYDCMDAHAFFSTSHPKSLEQECELRAAADLVVASSVPLETEARRHHSNVLLVRNGCDYEHFVKVPPKQPGLPPVIGYYGAIAEWFDTDLVADLAQRRRDWTFILVGSSAGACLNRISNLPNVVLAGEKPYAELPCWLERFDVAILPFKRTPLTQAVNPVKAYEILAAGKPLVSVPLPEMARLEPLVRTAAHAAEFEQMIADELAHPDAQMETKRRAFAKQNTWLHRQRELAPVIRQLCSRDGSRHGRLIS